MSRTLAALACALLAAFAAAGLALRASVPAPASLRFVNGSEPRTLDPGLMTGSPEGRIADAIFEGLTTRDPRSLRPAPGVASSWEISGDGLRYVFQLRPEARWSNGRPVTAADFVYAWRRLQDPALGSEYAYILHSVRHAEALNTHAAAADALLGPVREALVRLRSEAPGGLPAERWQRFAAEQRLGERLRGAGGAFAAGLLGRRSGSVSAAELAELEGELAGAAARLRASAAAAQAHFGVDEGVFAEGERTLVVELRAATPYFLELTAFYPTYPVPREAVLAAGASADWFLPETIVSNGPFRLAEWRVGERIRLARSESYWGRGEIRLDSVDALPIENATTALNLYLAGAVDWLPSPAYPSDLVDDLRLRPDFYASPGMVVYYYRFNCRRPPFDDPRVREALALAIDREAIVRDVLRLGQIPAYHVVPPGLPGYAAPRSALRFDPERARALLAEAGFGPGRPFPAIGILYNTAESHKQIAEVVADQLRQRLGIEARAYNQEWQAYQASVLAGDYDLARAGWIGDYLDPNTFLDLWLSGGGNNQTGWGDARYDALLRAASDAEGFAAAPGALLEGLREPAALRAQLLEAAGAREPGLRAAALGRVRMQLFREAEAILVQEAFPILPLHFYVVSGLVAPRVGGFYAELEDEDGSRRPNLQDLHPLRGMWIRP